MATTLIFNGVTLTPVTHQHSLWIRAAELARALGYKRPDTLTKLYTQNAREFTSDMTQVIEILDNTESVFPVRARVFSLRGCHLVAMFSRTKVARAFRRWVLDLLDRLEETPGQQGMQAQRRNITEDIIPAPDGASVAESLFAAINSAARTTRPGEFGLLDLSCLAGKARTEQPQPEQPEVPGYSVEELLEDSQNATRDIMGDIERCRSARKTRGDDMDTLLEAVQGLAVALHAFVMAFEKLHTTPRPDFPTEH